MGWLDSPISKVFKIYTIDKNGLETRIYPKHVFPFDTTISQNRLNYLFPEKKYVSGCLGAMKDLNQYLIICQFSESKNKSDEEIKKFVLGFIEKFGIYPNQENYQVKTYCLFNFIILSRSLPKKSFDLLKRIFSHIHMIERHKNLSDNKDFTKIKIVFERYFYYSKEERYVTLEKEEKIYDISVNEA